MHTIEPFYGWQLFYDSSVDDLSPFHGKEYNFDVYADTIYGYYIDPGWDYMGSETLYIKVLFAEYEDGYVIIELIGEWNDAIHNDVMHLKRNIIEHFLLQGITKFILIGENVFNFHGSDDCYYEEWFEEVMDGWIVAVGFRDFVIEEWRKFGIDQFFNFGGQLDFHQWRTFLPRVLFQKIDQQVIYRLEG
jgi:hypothetical protein